MHRSTFEIMSRAGAVGAEDAITEALSSIVGIGLAGVGASVGGVVGGVGGYLVGANGTTLFMDHIVWEPINVQNDLSR
jgi:hypothetical protein